MSQTKVLSQAELIDLIVAEGQKEQWHIAAYEVEVRPGVQTTVELKAYGKWVQFARVGFFKDGTPSDIKTKKRFREEVEKLITGLLHHVC
jgi:hypothetical protein